MSVTAAEAAPAAVEKPCPPLAPAQSLVHADVGALLAALRRIQVSVHRAETDIAFCAGDADHARVVAVSGGFATSAKLGIALDRSFVVRGASLLNTLATFGPDRLDASADLFILPFLDTQGGFVRLAVSDRHGSYRGRFALVPDAVEEAVRVSDHESACEREGRIVTMPAAQAMPALRRAARYAGLAGNDIKFRHVFFESIDGGLHVSGVSQSCAIHARLCDTALEPRFWSVPCKAFGLLLDSVQDQVMPEDATITFAFGERQMLARVGPTSWTLNLSAYKPPEMAKLCRMFPATWELQLDARAVARINESAGLLLEEERKHPMGLRFEADRGDVLLKSEGRGLDGEASMTVIEGAAMTGVMPPAQAIAKPILASALMAELKPAAITFRGSDTVPHIQARVSDVDGTLVFTPLRI